MLSKQLYRQEYPTGKKPEKSQIALVLAVNLFTRIAAQNRHKIHKTPCFCMQGHPRSLNSVAIESGCTTSY